MLFDSVKNFFSNPEVQQKLVAGFVVALIVAVVGFILRLIFKRKSKPLNGSVNTGNESTVQIATGDGTNQEISLDKSTHVTIGDKTIVIGRVESGATVNINVIDYQDGAAQSTNARVRSLFSEARVLYSKGEYSKAIEKFVLCLDSEKDREKVGAINLQIGNCYFLLRHYLKAAEFYRSSLREAHKANDKEGEASALVGIANTYLFRPASDGQARGNNVRQAVENNQQALKIFQKDEYPAQYATTQNNLGNIYRDLPSATAEERAENVKRAIQCYLNALEIRKKDEYPVDYATTQNNLGLAYMDLPSATAEEGAENVRKAIQCYLNALEIYKKDEYPVEYAATQNNLGNIYRDLPSVTAEAEAENVRKAIQCYLNALEIYKKDEYPVEYATTQNNLGTAYTALPSATAEAEAENVRKAIQYYLNALEIRKKDEYPVDYAMTQNNLGGAYTVLPSATAEEKAENIKRAIQCYQNALEIYKKSEYPHSYCATSANLGFALISIDKIKEGCFWLKEAYSLKQFLPDQGKRFEPIIKEHCKE